MLTCTYASPSSLISEARGFVGICVGVRTMIRGGFAFSSIALVVLPTNEPLVEEEGQSTLPIRWCISALAWRGIDNPKRYCEIRA